MEKMKALVFRDIERFGIEQVPIPRPGYGEALIRITLTTICGTDLHIVRGEYPVKSGLVIGHEPVGVVEELGQGVTGYKPGERVLVGAITPCGQCNFCLSGNLSQCGGAIGGWKFGNTINGAQLATALPCSLRVRSVSALRRAPASRGPASLLASIRIRDGSSCRRD